MAAPQIGITLIKKFTYRGNASEEFSNHYWLTGSTPADAAAWKTLTDLLIAQEKTCYPAPVSVVAAYGYNSAADDATAVYARDLTVSPDTVVAGTLSATNSVQCPGDAAVWVRWGLNRLNSKGKRVYLRKYFHPAMQQTASAADTVSTNTVTALNAFGATMQTGLAGGTNIITDRLGSTILNHGTSTYITTRTLKRRGKRPPT
jgi:hypothetical protein